MRRLLLLRHAKAALGRADERDHDRRLAPRGRRAAELMGDHLRRAGLLPDLVLCSSAWRTCETAARLDLPEDTGLEVDRDLYLAPPDTVLDLVRRVEDEVSTLLVVGHNPTTQELALGLAATGPGAGDPALPAAVAAKYPTGALAVLSLDGPWRALTDGGARLDAFVTPRDLGAGSD